MVGKSKTRRCAPVSPRTTLTTKVERINFRLVSLCFSKSVGNYYGLIQSTLKILHALCIIQLRPVLKTAFRTGPKLTHEEVLRDPDRLPGPKFREGFNTKVEAKLESCEG
jgi:hypothetical protein